MSSAGTNMDRDPAQRSKTRIRLLWIWDKLTGPRLCTCIRDTFTHPFLCTGSLAVSLKEEKLGKWYNFETGEYGDMLGKKCGARKIIIEAAKLDF